MENEPQVGQMPGQSSQVQPIQSTKGLVWFFYVLIIIVGILNAFVGPVFWPRFGILSAILQSGAWIVFLFTCWIAIFEFAVAATIGTFVIWLIFKKQKKFWRIFWLVLLSVVVFYFLRIFAGQVVAKYIERNNYLQATQALSVTNLSQKNKLINDSTNKKSIDIKNNRVIWIEHKDNTLLFAKNEWEAFLFDFDLEKSTGRVAKISDAAKYDAIVDDAYLNGEGAFWLEDTNLMFQNSLNNKKKTVKENIGALLSVDGDNLLIQHSVPGWKSSYGPKPTGLYLLNAKTGEEKDLSSLEVRGKENDGKLYGTQIGGDYICFDMDPSDQTNKHIGIYNFKTATSQTLNLPMKDGAHLVTCSGDYIAYSDYDNKTRKSTRKVYSLSKKAVVFETIREIGGSKIVDGKYYYSDTTNTQDESLKANGLIYVKDLGKNIDSQLKLNLEGKTLEEWDTDGKYIAFLTGEPSGADYEHEYDSEAWLQLLSDDKE